MRLRTMLVTVVITAVLATACGTGGGTQGGRVELTYWAWAPNMEKVVEGWNSTHPDVHVTVQKQDGGDPAVVKFLTAIKAGSGAPDLMQAEYQKIPTLVAANGLADVARELPAGLASRFAPSTWEAVTLGGSAVYGVPQDLGPMVFYYREDVFAQLGIPVPTTWNEYATAAERIHTADPKKYLGTFSATDPGWFAGLTQQAGASWWGVDGGAWSVAIDSPAARKVTAFWGGLVARGVIDNKPMYTPDWNAALNDGSQVGWVSAIWGPGVLAGNAQATQGKWRMAPLPQWDTSAATGAWGGSTTAISAQTTHKKEAAEFAAWLNTDPQATQLLVQQSDVYPADTAAQTSAVTKPPSFFPNQPTFFQDAAKIAQTVRPFTYGPNVNVAYSAYNDVFAAAAEGRTAAGFTAALSALQKTTIDDLKASGLPVRQ